MRTVFVVTYDISDPKRLRRVFDIMKGFGVHLQLSVFRCELSASEMVRLRTKLRGDMNEHEDQVLFVELGPPDGRGGSAISSLGRPLAAVPRGPAIF